MASTTISECPVWDIQREFYKNEGTEGWNNKVPFYATSNAFIANAYANIIIAYTRECVEKGIVKSDQPFLLLELGAGTGKFTYLLLKRLIELQVATHCTTLAVKYLATDFVEKNLRFIKEQPNLEDYIAQGYLELAMFDIEKDDSLNLLYSRKTISLSDDFLKRNPLIIISNYVFDSLPQDIFRTTAGSLQIGRINYRSDPGYLSNNESVDMEKIGDISYHNISLPYYGDPFIDEVLGQYAMSGYEGYFSMPVCAIKFLKRIIKSGPAPHLMICSDKAVHKNDGNYSLTPPEITYHQGAFSSTVNFNALDRSYRLNQGDCYHQSTPSDIITSAFIAGSGFNDLPKTAFALMNHLDITGPGDLLNLYKFLTLHQGRMDLYQIFSFLNILNWDTSAFDICASTIRALLKTANTTLIMSLAENIPRVFNNFYKTPGCTDTLFNIALILQEIKQFKGALHYYNLSCAYFGYREDTRYNMALCELNSENYENAKDLFTLILQENPHHILSKGWIAYIDEREKP